MKTYKKKPESFEAFQLTEALVLDHYVNGTPIPLVRSSSGSYHAERKVVNSFFGYLDEAHARSVCRAVRLNDWICRSADGSLAVYSDDAFKALFSEEPSPC